jgi:hypothetical protein
MTYLVIPEVKLRGGAGVAHLISNLDRTFAIDRSIEVSPKCIPYIIG